MDVSNNVPRRSHFTIIPNFVDDLGLDAYARSLYMHLARVIGAGEGGACWQSTTTLADYTGMSRGRVSRAKRTLVVHHLIRIEKRSV